MKKLNIVTGAVFAVATLSVSPIVFAETGPGSSGSTENKTTTTTTTATTTESTTDTTKKPVSAEEAAKKATELKARLEDNKAALKTKLDEAAKKRITAKCKPAQSIVQKAESNATTVADNRGKAYAKIAENVQKLIDKLKENGKDTTALEAALATTKTKAQDVATKMTEYKQTLADISALDCAADPTAFQAALEAARTQRDAVKAAATDLRSFVQTTLKAEIAKFKPAEPAKTTTTTTTTPATTTTGGN